MLRFAQVRSNPHMFLLTCECYLVPSRSFLLILECFFSTCIRIRCHHSPGKEKKHSPRKETDTNQKKHRMLLSSDRITYFTFMFLLTQHVPFVSSLFRSDPDDAPLPPGPIWSRHVSFDPWMLLSPFTFVSFDPWMFLFHLHSHPLSSLTWERKETQSTKRNSYVWKARQHSGWNET